MSSPDPAAVAKLLRHLGHPAAAPLWVAVSGGADSMALLHLLVRAGTRVSVFHLDHQARPESQGDADFVRERCGELGVPCRIESADVAAHARQAHVSFETAGRRLRYHWLDELAEPGWAATAHTMDDQAETLLLRLLRGAGSSGLGGIRPRLQRRCAVLRPLLNLRRSALRSWLRDQGLAWREDASNQDMRVPRNRVRAELLALLAGYNPRIVEALHRTAMLLQEDDAWLQAAADAASQGDWRDLPAPLRRRLLRRVPGLEHADWQQIVELERLAAGKHFELGGRAYTWQAGQVRVQQPVTPWGPYYLTEPGRLGLPEIGRVLVIEAVPVAGPSTPQQIYLPPGPVQVRSRRPGDRFRLPAGGHMKVKNFFIDQKVPRSQRDSIPLLVLAAGIVWVAGWRLDPTLVRAPGAADAWRLRIEEEEVQRG